MRTFLALASLSLLCACGPQAGDPCGGDEVNTAICSGSDVLLCVCAAPEEDGTCPAEEWTWQRDPLCSCSANGMICA